MMIAAALGVKDEVELIGHQLDHLRAIGVGHIIAADAGSTDGTAEILRAAPDVEYIVFDDSRPGVDDHLARRLLAAARAAGAGWLLNCDADEFWLPATGRLADSLPPAGVDVLEVMRFNVPLLPDGAAMPFPAPPDRHDAVLLYVPRKGRAERRDTLQGDAAAPWIASMPVGKVMTRLDGVVSLTAGGHRARAAPGVTLRETRAGDIVIAHVPFSTPGRFRRKMANIAALTAAAGHRWAPNAAWHWRRWLDNTGAAGRDEGGGGNGGGDGGGIAAEFARNMITPDRLAGLRAEGIVQSAADLLAGGRM